MAAWELSTPPGAFDLSVPQGATGKSMGCLTTVMPPNLFIMLAFVVLLAVFPGILPWLPSVVLGK